METSNKKRMDAPQAPATEEQAARAESSGHGPLWAMQSNRVKAAVWKHEQKGKSRYTIAICRSYFDQKAGEWKNVHFYDRKDLPDVTLVRERAEAFLSSVEQTAAA